MNRVLHQMPASAGRVAVEVRRGEASIRMANDESQRSRREFGDTRRDLLLQSLAREKTLQRAWKRVKANKGAAGVDGLDILQTEVHLKSVWPSIKHQLEVRSEAHIALLVARNSHR